MIVGNRVANHMPLFQENHDCPPRIPEIVGPEISIARVARLGFVLSGR